MIEVGYKYRFFGEDARVSTQNLSIGQGTTKKICQIGCQQGAWYRLFPRSELPYRWYSYSPKRNSPQKVGSHTHLLSSTC